MPDIGTMHQLNPEPPHIGTMHQLGPEPLHTGEIITPQAQAEEYAREAQESAANAALSAAAAQSAAETAQQAAESIAPALNEKAAAIHTAAGPAPIVSIPDAAAAPVDALTAGIEPVQDLHGYDNPWPAGGGVNKCPSPLQTTTTQSGITFTCDGKGGCSLSGTASSGAVFGLLIDEVVLPSTVYVHLFNSNYYSENTPVIDFMNGSTMVDFVGINVTQNRIYNGTSDMGGKTINGIRIRVPSGFTGSVTFKIYISDSNAVVDFSPYSNICPITGWTGAKVTRTGKNLFDKSKAVFYSNVARFIKYGVDVYADTLPNGDCVLDVGTYTLSISGDGTEAPTSMSVFDSSGNRIALIYNNKILTFTTTSTGAYYLAVNFTDAVTWADYNIQLELGSTATAYTPYSDSTYPITFPSEAGTVYGGTLDVTNGVLTVDRAMIASYAGETLPGEWISDRDVYAAGTTPTTGAQVVYQLATPITYQLTPQEIRTLLGTNNIWADTGDTAVWYKADTKLYIDKKFAELQALILGH